MNAGRYQKIKQIFNQALEMPEAEREEFLRANCDAETRVEVEKMLIFADTDADADTLEKNAFQIFTNGGASAKPPENIGGYRILREIGRGGMGAVYEAVRENRDFRQRAALKIIKRGMDSDAILSRFRVEQKILASLEHPFIARFLDGGMTREGLPFYAMEFVEGEFIDDFCRAKDLSIEARLELFRKVCAAVQYAHQNLVVHRDLKPSNILVTGDGAPKLLDFGIGKILRPDAAGEFGTATELGMMTPAYASPEQIAGRRIGTASDVYSLGVILYELLTGQKPYKLKTKSPGEIEKAILESEPVRPSSAAGGKSKSETQNPKSKTPNPKSLKGDLDTIILKALRKEPENRYASAQEFSEDIRRYLEGLPIRARPQTFAYRAAKFVRRNRVGVVAAALVFLSLCAGIAVALWQANRAERQRVLAEKRFAEVRQIANNVVFKYTEAISNLPNSIEVREMLLKDASDYLDRLAQDAHGDAALARELAAAYAKLSDLQGAPYGGSTGNIEKAVENLRKALALEEAILATQPADAETRRGIIATYTKLGNLTYVSADAGETQNAYRKAENLLEEFLQKEPENISLLAQLARLQIQTGSHASESALDMTTARRYQTAALATAQKMLALAPADAAAKSVAATAHSRLGMLTGHPEFSELEDRAGALENFRKALEIRRELLRADPENVGYRRQYAMNLTSEADILREQANFAEALKIYDEAGGIFDALVRRDGGDFFSRAGAALVLNKSGAALAAAGQVADGLPKLREANRRYEQFLVEKKGDISIKNTFIGHLLDFGEILTREKQFAEAEKIYRRAAAVQAEIMREARGFRILEINEAAIHAALGAALSEQNKNLSEARAHLESGLARLGELKTRGVLFRRYADLYRRAENARQKIG